MSPKNPNKNEAAALTGKRRDRYAVAAVLGFFALLTWLQAGTGGSACLTAGLTAPDYPTTAEKQTPTSIGQKNNQKEHR